jgi:hypothetical protein
MDIPAFTSRPACLVPMALQGFITQRAYLQAIRQRPQEPVSPAIGAVQDSDLAKLLRSRNARFDIQRLSSQTRASWDVGTAQPLTSKVRCQSAFAMRLSFAIHRTSVSRMA